jgi:Fe2+ transport system protein FeoA
MKLSRVEVGKTVKIKSIETPKKITERLNNIGLTNGIDVKVIRKAPLGDPLQIKVRDFYLAIRISDADKIMVERDE